MNEQAYLHMDNVVSLLHSPSMGDHARLDGDGRSTEVGEACASVDVATDLFTMLDENCNSPKDGNERHDVLEPKHKIFLSHSGAQKSFVADLYADLVSRDRYAFFDKSRSSLPIGEKFPNLIFNAIEQCLVGVVVLSEEFFTKTKWPMLELVAMVKESKQPNRRIKIIPVYYMISRDKCLNPTVQNKWMRKYWKKWEQEDKSCRIHMEEWKEALRIFGSTSGVVMKDGVLDGELRGEIVEAVCKNVLRETKWDDTGVQGKTRLYEEFCKKMYGGLKPKELKGKVRVVGLYGMGGMGKTTACKVLCNAVCVDYDDKVCHAEFGSRSKLELLKKVLKAFSNLDVEILDNIRDVEEYYAYLRNNITKERVFLALDNVSDDTKEQAKVFLRTNYGRGSVVLVTARSMNVLQCVGIEKKNCFAMPELEREEAKALFLSHGCLKEEEVDVELLEKCMERCYFFRGESTSSSWDSKDSNGWKHYHPLALKALGIGVGDEIRKHCGGRQKEVLKRIQNLNMSRQKEHPVFSILRSSFDSLLEEDQLFFLHVALFLPIESIEDKYTAIEWLQMVHGEETNAIKFRLECLKQKSLLESFGIFKFDFKMHDLWSEFAEAEIKTGKFKDQVFLEDVEGRMSMVDLTRFRELGLVKLRVGGVEAVDLRELKVLKSLDLFIEPYYLAFEILKDFALQVRGLGSLENLTFLSLEGISSSECIAEIGLLTNLQIVALRYFRGFKLPDLSKLTNLRILVLGGCLNLRSIKLRNLSNLVRLHLFDCIGLQSLDTSGCTSMTEIDLRTLGTTFLKLDTSSMRFHGVGRLCGLGHYSYYSYVRKLDITGCKSMIDLGNNLEWLENLEELRARNCDSLVELPRCRLPNLRVVDIEPWKVPDVGFEWSPGLIRTLVRKFKKHCTSTS